MNAATNMHTTPSFVIPFVAPTHAAYENHRGGRAAFPTYDLYVENSRRSTERSNERGAELDRLVGKIRELLSAEPRTEGQLYFLLSEHPANDVRRALGAMIGHRVAAETTGEVVIAGYRSGSECYGLRK